MLDARGPAARWERHGDCSSFVVVASGSPSLDPAVGASEGVVAAVDGHIPNRKALAAEQDLEPDASPGEVVARLIARTGFVRAFSRLPGNVSVAAWQPETRTGWLARDRAGARPLAWSRSLNGIAFATEARALVVGAQPRSAGGLDSLVALGCALESGYAGVHPLAPGEVLSFAAGDPVSERPSWSPGHPSGAAGNVDRWARSMRYGLDLAYANGSRFAAPHGIALGGGLASAALLAVRPRDASPALALTLVRGGVLEPGVAALAAAAGLPLLQVELDADALDALVDQVAPNPAWVRPEAWVWAALSQRAWREGLVGLACGLGARAGFDPGLPFKRMPSFLAGVRAAGARLRAALPGPAADLSLLAATLGPWHPGDDFALAALSARLEGQSGRVSTEAVARHIRLPEVDLAAFDAGCASFGLEGIAPFADPAFMAVACQAPAGVHHFGGRRGLLARVGGGNAGADPGDWPLDVAALISGFSLDTLSSRLENRLDAAHVRAVVAEARRGHLPSQRRVFALEMVARGVTG